MLIALPANFDYLLPHPPFSVFNTFQCDNIGCICMKADLQKKSWKVLSSEIVFSNKWCKIKKDSVKLPNGKVIDDYFITELGNIVMVFALTKDKHVVFVKQYRHGVKKVLLELPAGIHEQDEVLEIAAKRELLEETGYVARDLIPLGRVVDYPTKNSHHIDLFLTKDVVYQTPPIPEDTEDIEVVLIPLDNLLELIEEGGIFVTGTITCIIKALIYLKVI